MTSIDARLADARHAARISQDHESYEQALHRELAALGLAVVDMGEATCKKSLQVDLLDAVEAHGNGQTELNGPNSVSMNALREAVAAVHLLPSEGEEGPPLIHAIHSYFERLSSEYRPEDPWEAAKQTIDRILSVVMHDRFYGQVLRLEYANADWCRENERLRRERNEARDRLEICQKALLAIPAGHEEWCSAALGRSGACDCGSDLSDAALAAAREQVISVCPTMD